MAVSQSGAAFCPDTLVQHLLSSFIVAMRSCSAQRRVAGGVVAWCLTERLGAGYTPLHMAVGYSHVAVAAALLEAGADPEVR